MPAAIDATLGSAIITHETDTADGVGTEPTLAQTLINTGASTLVVTVSGEAGQVVDIRQWSYDGKLAAWVQDELKSLTIGADAKPVIWKFDACGLTQGITIESLGSASDVTVVGRLIGADIGSN